MKGVVLLSAGLRHAAALVFIPREGAIPDGAARADAQAAADAVAADSESESRWPPPGCFPYSDGGESAARRPPPAAMCFAVPSDRHNHL